MDGRSAPQVRESRVLALYARYVTYLAYAMMAAAMLGVLAMMAITCVDVVLRLFKIKFIGAFDLVKIAGTITIACALPYTTAVKGHVAIEYFFHKLSRRGRVIVDTFARLAGIALFGVLAWKSAEYGASLRASGQVTQTLQIPEFWVPYVVAASCAVTVLVIIHNLLHPGKEMIKP